MNVSRGFLWIWDKIVGNFLWWIIVLILGSFGAAVKSRWPQLKVFLTTFPPKHPSQAIDNNAAVSMPFYVLSILLLGCAVILMALWNQHIQRDTKRLHVQMLRFVLPRSLSEDQMASVGKVLSQSEPQIVEIHVAKGDREASNYASNIWTALIKGGWTAQFKYESDLQDGLQLNVNGPMEPPLSPLQQIQRKPTPYNILEEAFKSAEIQVDGRGSGSVRALTETTISIVVGRRPRDIWAVRPKNYPPMPDMKPLTDDDF